MIELREAPATYEKRIADLERDLELFKEECTFLREKNEDLDRELRRMKDIRSISGKRLHDGVKTTILALDEYIEKEAGPPNADGYYLVKPWRVGELVGKSPEAVRSKINLISNIHENGRPVKDAELLPLYDKRLVKLPSTSPDRDFDEAMFLKKLPLRDCPQAWEDVLREGNWGGADRGQGRRKKCECGGDLIEKDIAIIKQTIEECTTCGKVHGIDAPRRVHASVALQSVENQVDFDNQQDTSAENQVDFNESPSNQLDTEDITTIPVQVDCKEQPRENQVDFVESDQDEEPNTPPPPLDPAQIELDAAQLLLEIAGEGSQHIEMVPEAQKYTTIHRALHRGDMFAHLRGHKTVGSKLYYANGKLRAICVDGDTAQHWQQLKDAAKLLQAAGFKVILEPSPAPIGSKHEGGGHLWILFEAMVDAYSAFQTIYQYAGDLSKEQWPSLSGGGNRVRLPGGKYVAPNFEAWCSLYDADGLELSHDGPGAARVLLDYQTSIDVLTEYERPVIAPIVKPAPKPQPNKQGWYLEKDVAPYVIADFNATHSWDELADKCGGFNKRGYFSAIWRGDRNPNVSVDPKTDLAKDFSSSAWLDYSMDKHQVYCLIEGREDWQAFRKRDLAQRCKDYREQVERIAS